jgi:hypothetical protein
MSPAAHQRARPARQRRAAETGPAAAAALDRSLDRACQRRARARISRLVVRVDRRHRQTDQRPGRPVPRQQPPTTIRAVSGRVRQEQLGFVAA